MLTIAFESVAVIGFASFIIALGLHLRHKWQLIGDRLARPATSGVKSVAIVPAAPRPKVAVITVAIVALSSSPSATLGATPQRTALLPQASQPSQILVLPPTPTAPGGSQHLASEPEEWGHSSEEWEEWEEFYIVAAEVSFGF